jgi:hypothetical protein
MILTGIVLAAIILFVSMILLPLEWMNLAFINFGISLFFLAYYVKYRYKHIVHPPKGAYENVTVFSGALIAGGILMILTGLFFFLMESIFPELLVEDAYFIETRHTIFAQMMGLVFLMFVYQNAFLWMFAMHGVRPAVRLRAQLDRKPMACPMCDLHMERGFIRSVQTRWHEHGTKKIFPPSLSKSPYAFPSNICKRCNMLLGQYKNTPKKALCSAPTNQYRHNRNLCPHCGGMLKRGSMIAAFPFFWSDEYRAGISSKAKFRVSVAIPIGNSRLSTKLCPGCGTFVSTYNPDSFRKWNIIGLAINLLLISGILYGVWLLIPFMFGV